MQTVQVVAAVLEDEQGRVLITQRPAGKPLAGYWEFPGGKLEPGEAPLTALKRELHEELGVTVHDARPLIRLNHDYPDRRVELEAWRVIHCSGEAQSREGQSLAWVRPAELPGWNLLPADGPIVTAIRLPPLMLVTPSPGADHGRFLETLERGLERGMDFIQLRAPELTLPHYTSLARAVIALCHRQGARIILNTEPELARELGADGVHLSSARLSRIAGRPLPEDVLVGASCHDETEIHQALVCGLDYILLGPVLPTASHPGSALLGWHGFAELQVACTLPVYAIGGMLPEYLEKVRGFGGHGIAVMRGLWDGYSSSSS